MSIVIRAQRAMAVVPLLFHGACGTTLANTDHAAKAFQAKDYERAAELWRA